MANRLIEFFEGEKKQLSMSRLLAFLSFVPATIVVLATKTDSALQWYVGAYVTGYVGGKAMDCWMPPETPIKHGDIDADIN